MKSRKQGSVKAAGLTKPKALCDVPASTSLPPLVEGELRGFLRVTVSRLRWSVARPPPVTRVRLRWWGESSDGTLFIPRRDDASPSRKTTARFPVRCGTKQLTSYLADMGNLVLEVLSKHDCLPVAHARVPDISRLSQSKPITGFYALVSPSSKKLGQLEVSLHLEPVAGACRKRGSGTDLSGNVPHVATLDKAPPPATDKSYVSSGGNTFRGKDGPRTHRDETVENFKLQANGGKEDGRPRNDILSVILERGSKLRDAMLVSALKSDMDAAPVLKDLQLPLQRDNARAPSMPSQVVLEKVPHAQADDEVGDRRLGSSPDVDLRAVDLLLGRSKTPPPWQGEGSFPDTLSIHSSASGDSELGDPQYDHSLLENLFYKTPMSDLRADEAAADSQRRTESLSATDTDKQLRPPASTTGDDVAAELQGASTDIGIPLSQERLTFLSFMRLVKVTVCSVSVPACCASPPTEKPPSKSPSLLRRKKCTYFVEYSFPKTSSSGRHGRSVVPGVEVTRAASSNVTEGVVSFNQLSVFPVRFSKTTVEVWWSTELLFRIYVRKNDQKKAVVMGEASHPLRCLLQSQRLSQSLALPVRTVDGAVRQLCLLKVLLELSTSNRDSEMCEKREDRSTRSTQSPPRESSQCLGFCSEEPAARPSEDSAPNVPPVRRSAEEAPEVLLHTLLMVPDGKNFTGGPAQAVNVYLNCKMFWCDEVARSVVSWGRANPSFNFVQVTPVALTAHLLERMRNNVMVIEVWQKTGGSGHEGLLGLVKLPLHQFYVSFRDPKIAQLLLQAQYPVLGVDCYMPVVDVFSGGCRGSLRVTLAMGLCEQVLALQRARDEEGETPGRPPLRPLRLLEHQPGLPAKAAGYFRAGDSSQAASLASRAPAMTEHVFTIRVETVTGLTPLQSTVWGEADCYVQYAFPCQEGADVDATLHEYNTDLKPFRTATTLCVPDPVLGHTETHALLAPEGVPVQKLLLSSLSSQGLSGGGGVRFEVWCRYYYPNVREQLVAKGILPLSKLCAMVTMQGQHPAETRMFSIPLLPTADDLAAHQPLPSGLLDVRVGYNYRPARADAPAARGAASCPVTLVLQVHRACGLQAAARAVAQHDERYDYFASVGVNSYVSVRLSFLPDDEPTCTRVAARTFCPEFEHLAEVRCHALVRKSGGETCSLAEQLAEAWAVFAVWNKDSRRGATCRPPDVMLGTVKIQLVDLLRKTTGISGWFGISAARESPQSQHASVGGLEISIGFAHRSERERLIRVARDLGWDPTRAQVDCDELGAWELSARKLSLTLSVPRAWLPLRCLLLPGHDSLQRSTYCYLRYKFYEHEAFCSHMKHPCAGEATEGDRATVTFQGSRTLELMSSQPLLWYLREERLEVQVWVAFQKDKGQRPRDTDRLLGSAFVDLSSLAKAHGHKLTLSGVYPLFRRSAADLQGAALRVHISLTADGHLPTAEDPPADSDSQEETSVQEPAAPPTVPAPTVPPPTAPTPPPLPPQPTQSQTTQDDASSRAAQVMSDDLSFPVTLAVHGAKNLSLNGESGGEGTLRCYVSYVVADSAKPVSTAVAAQSDRPVWDHQHDCRLSKQLLLDPQQSLVFKVWHKSGAEAERAIGFASVDLTPLLCGLRSLCGWYNVTDFGGHCRGQLKVSVQPLEWVHDLRGQRKAAADDAEPSSQLAPRSYRTSATYSSFPSHISRYPEQHISSPEHVDAVFPQSSAPSESERHHEHMQKVRLHHRSLQEQAGLHWGSGDELTPSSSLLFSTISGEVKPSISTRRKIMSEQDNIQRYFSSKIAPPAFLTASEPDERESDEGAAPHFLVTSPHKGQSQEAICPILHSRSAKEKHADASSSPHAASSRQPSFPTSQPEEKESEEAETTDGDGECRSRCSSDEDEEEEEDYEEVVVEPRHLNELPISTRKSALQNSVPSHPDQSRTKSGGAQEAAARDRPPDSMDESSEDASISPSEDDAVGAGGSARPKQVSLPNFFLPSQQLEASLRVVRLAPSFSNSSGDTERGPTPPQIPRRGPRHCPDMSPTSRKRQTERFARICAARLDDDDDDD